MNIYVVLTLVLLFYIIVPVLCMLFIKNDKVLKTISYIFLVLFFGVLCVGVFGKVNIQKTVLVSFDFGGKWFAKSINFLPYTLNVQDILINIVMLIPVGMFCCINFKHKIVWSLVLGFAIGIIIEFLQFALPIVRSPQLSDVLLNTVSSVIGALFAMFIMFVRNKFANKK